MQKRLVVNDGSRDRELILLRTMVVGRDPACDFSYDHSLLSRRHAEFAADGDRVIVRDLGSRNGLFVNGSKTAESPLRPGDIVQIGPLRVQWVVDGMSPSIVAAAPDDDGTTVFQTAPEPAVDPAAVTPPKSAAPATEPADDATRVLTVPADDDQTQMIPAAAPPRRDDARPPARTGKEAPRVFVNTAGARPPRPAAASDASASTAALRPLADEPARSADRRAERPPVAEPPALGTFVFAVLAALTSVVFLSAVLPLVAERPTGPSIGLAALVSAAAAVAAGALLTRRVARALDAARRGGQS